MTGRTDGRTDWTDGRTDWTDGRTDGLDGRTGRGGRTPSPLPPPLEVGSVFISTFCVGRYVEDPAGKLESLVGRTEEKYSLQADQRSIAGTICSMNCRENFPIPRPHLGGGV